MSAPPIAPPGAAARAPPPASKSAFVAAHGGSEVVAKASGFPPPPSARRAGVHPIEVAELPPTAPAAKRMRRDADYAAERAAATRPQMRHATSDDEKEAGQLTPRRSRWADEPWFPLVIPVRWDYECSLAHARQASSSSSSSPSSPSSP
eukprot:6727990-Pyramimonas_sp.AAC.1